MPADGRWDLTQCLIKGLKKKQTLKKDTLKTV
jgi:hypothetical protein